MGPNWSDNIPYMIVVSKGIRLGQSEVIGEVFSLEVTPGLRGINDSPLIWRTAVLQPCLKYLLSRNPVIGTGTEALRLIKSFLASL